MIITGGTRVFALLGQPVDHSISPQMHNAAFHALGINAVYVALPCDAGHVRSLIKALTGAGGGGNVTVPHKRVAAGAVSRMVDDRITVCNTFWSEEGQAVGDNTDIVGIGQGLADLGAPASGWLILGTGGSARAAVAAARQSGASVAVRSREPSRAAGLEREAEALGVAVVKPDACDVVINATPLGLAADPLPLEPGQCPGARFALDLVYGAGGTPWVRAMRAAGVHAHDGRGVLVAQGAAAFRRWFPDKVPPVELMRAAVHAALG